MAEALVSWGKPKAVLKPTESLNSPNSPLLPAFPSGLGAPGQWGILDQTQSQRHWSSSRVSSLLSQARMFICLGSIIPNTNHRGCTRATSKGPADHKRCSVTCKGRQQSASPRLRRPPSILSLIAQTLDLNQQFILGYRP